MSEELKACSYCGKQPQGNNWHTYGRNPKDEMRYFCANHDCPNGFHKVLTLEEWNTRPIEDALRAELAAAQAEVERMRGIIRRAEFGKSVHTAWDKYQRCTVCGNRQSSGHDVNCPYYQWEGNNK